MDNFASATSQHVFPRASINSTRIPAPAAPVIEPHTSTLTALWKMYAAEPVQLRRSREGRALSRARIHRAEGFMPSCDRDAPGDFSSFLYFAGITAQLALSSHLLDVGFPDDWCARHVGLHVSRSLAYANATGFGYECGNTARLAQVLCPYWKWNPSGLAENPEPDDGGFQAEEVVTLLRGVIDHVYLVTGHRRSNRRSRVDAS